MLTQLPPVTKKLVAFLFNKTYVTNCKIIMAASLVSLTCTAGSEGGRIWKDFKEDKN
jgi:hypothetical protein